MENGFRFVSNDEVSMNMFPMVGFIHDAFYS